MQKDQTQRFIFKKRAVRGCLVRLNESYQTITLQHHYTPLLSQCLGEALLGVTLLASAFKKKGQTTLQFQGEGSLQLLSARITSDHAIRGLVRATPDLISLKNLSKALHHGTLTLSYEGNELGQTYQSIIPVDSPSIAQALEQYFIQSEQVPTRFFLSRTPECAAGLLLQILPSAEGNAAEDFQYATVLAETLSSEELLELDFETILRRLYHEDEIELFPPTSLHFGCHCSLEKMKRAVLNLGRTEAESILLEQAFIEVHCEFCGHTHSFDESDIDEILTESGSDLYH